MVESGIVRLNINRGATVTEFRNFLDDLEHAYISIYHLPSYKMWRRASRRFPFPKEFFGLNIFLNTGFSAESLRAMGTYPPDQLEITKINIQSPGWIELCASLNPLQQIREYLKDRHERKKDKEWKWKSEKEREIAELDILCIQADRERTKGIREFYELLDSMDMPREEKKKILWERIGQPLSRLARHQDTGFLGSQNDNVD